MLVNPVLGQPEAIAEGRDIYRAKCLVCHQSAGARGPNLFATRLSEGMHEFTYMIRATTAGTFITAPASAEEMYEPEVFGRTASVIVEVQP